MERERTTKEKLSELQLCQPKVTSHEHMITECIKQYERIIP